MNDSVSILVAVFLILVALRWMLGGSQQLPGQQPGQRRAPARRPQHRATPQMVEMVRNVFPNIPVAAIVADLQRTGSVETTIDNALRDGGLPLPPPVTPPSPPSNSNGSSSSSGAQKPSNYTNLMNRYKIDAETKDSSSEPEEPAKIWENSPDKRQETLRKRKEFMVLQARRKMLEKQQQKVKEAEPVATSSSSSVVPDIGKVEEEMEEAGYDEMSVEQLNSLSPEERRRHLLEAVERRAPGQ
ncbi:hypothetical protein INT45_001055 [Circinella minor]|uniref:CUE domain-containing protein n=1 Tax=Circinella minor TaxID=1195481 RepID=A0A8H7SEQ3_9FUNG|nr:hypothetical protein INT45_001055 [Circinella minor]